MYKKVCVPIIELLEANDSKKVASVLDDVKALCLTKSKVSGKTAESRQIYNANKTLVALNDWFYNRWMPLVGDKAVEFGIKVNTKTGLSSMCKEATSIWTKQQAIYQKGMPKLVDDISNGVLQPSDISSTRAKLEADRTNVPATELGFATREEVIAYLEEEGEDLLIKVEVSTET